LLTGDKRVDAAVGDTEVATHDSMAVLSSQGTFGRVPRRLTPPPPPRSARRLSLAPLLCG
jgi:hypothetical protein